VASRAVIGALFTFQGIKGRLCLIGRKVFCPIDVH
jgi:hypothetical protein